VEREAQYIVAQLLVRQTPQATGDEAKDMDMWAIDVESLGMIHPRTVGVEALGVWAMEQIDLPGLLRSAAMASMWAHGRARLRTRHL
jgi:hypothetical protein